MQRCELIQALQNLSSSDVVLSAVIEAVGSNVIEGYVERPFFDALATAIIGQQLSARAAQTIQLRLSALCLLGRPYEPAQVLGVSVDQMRSAGLSRSKAVFIRGIAQRISTGEFDFQSLGGLPDNEILAKMIQLDGVGPWTAEMVMIFGLRRPDVLSVRDAALRRAVAHLYGIETNAMTDTAFIQLAEPWRPYRSIASRCLWRLIDEPA